ncbi:MAG: hypothetical protein JXP34_18875 [Planctomycetes bacterium]|nr:hypothetical protein [Planctomycetota bacterium]
MTGGYREKIVAAFAAGALVAAGIVIFAAPRDEGWAPVRGTPANGGVRSWRGAPLISEASASERAPSPGVTPATPGLTPSTPTPTSPATETGGGGTAESGSAPETEPPTTSRQPSVPLAGDPGPAAGGADASPASLSLIVEPPPPAPPARDGGLPGAAIELSSTRGMRLLAGTPMAADAGTPAPAAAPPAAAPSSPVGVPVTEPEAPAEPAKEPAVEPAVEPAKEPPAEPAAKPAAEPAKEPAEVPAEAPAAGAETEPEKAPPPAPGPAPVGPAAAPGVPPAGPAGPAAPGPAGPAAPGPAAPGPAGPAGPGTAAPAEGAGAPAPGQDLEGKEVVQPGQKPGKLSKGRIAVNRFLEYLAWYFQMPVVYDSVAAETYFKDKYISIQDDTEATFEIVKTILDANGYTLFKRPLSDGRSVIEVLYTKAPGVKSTPGGPVTEIIGYTEERTDFDPENVVTIAVVLKYAESNEVYTALQSLFSTATKGGFQEVGITRIQTTNTLLIRARFEVADFIRKLMPLVDVAPIQPEMILETIKVREAEVSELVAVIEEVLDLGTTGMTAGRSRTSTSTRRTAFASPRPATPGATPAAPPGTAAAQLAEYYQTRLIPETRTQQIVVVTYSGEDLDLIMRLVDELDVKIDLIRRNSHYYQVRFLKADDVAPIIQQLIEGTAAAGGLTGTRRSRTTTTATRTSPVIPTTSPQAAQQTGQRPYLPTRIVPHLETNSLLIQAEPEEYDEILRILTLIDRKRRQVFLESAFVQVKASSELNATIELLAGSLDDRKTRAIAFSQLGLSELTVAGDPTSGLSDLFTRVPTPPGVGLVAAMGHRGQLPVLLHLFKNNSDSQIVATPFIVADDNEENSIDIKTTAYIQQTVSTNVAATSSTEQEDAGITLTIIPTISGSENAVLLDLSLVVSEFAATSTAGGSLPDKGSNTLTSRVTVPNGELFVVGGLWRENKAKVVDKIPIVGDIPLIGWLFQSKAVTRARDNLYAFLTAHILSDELFRDASDLTRQAVEKGVNMFGEGLRIQNFDKPKQYGDRKVSKDPYDGEILRPAGTHWDDPFEPRPRQEARP